MVEQRFGAELAVLVRAHGDEVIAVRAVGEARAEWEIFGDVARHVDPDRGHLASFETADALRAEVARVVQTYAGIDTLVELGDDVVAGQPAARVHVPEKPWVGPLTLNFARSGMVLCKRTPARIRRGDCLFHIGTDARL